MADINKAFALTVIADITAYQAEMAKVPGVTEKQAAAAALRMEREMVKGAAAAGRAAKSGAEAASAAVAATAKAAAKAASDAAAEAAAKIAAMQKQAASDAAASAAAIIAAQKAAQAAADEAAAKIVAGQKAVADGLARSKESASALASAMSRVSPEAAAATNAVGALSGAVKAVYVALGPVGVALAAVGAAAAYAFKLWSDSMGEAEDQASEAAIYIIKQQLGMVEAVDANTQYIQALEKEALSKRLGTIDRFYHEFNRLIVENHTLSELFSGNILEWAKDEQAAYRQSTRFLQLQSRGFKELAEEAKAAAKAKELVNAGEEQSGKWLEGQADAEAKYLSDSKSANKKAQTDKANDLAKALAEEQRIAGESRADMMAADHAQAEAEKNARRDAIAEAAKDDEKAKADATKRAQQFYKDLDAQRKADDAKKKAETKQLVNQLLQSAELLADTAFSMFKDMSESQAAYAEATDKAQDENATDRQKKAAEMAQASAIEQFKNAKKAAMAEAFVAGAVAILQALRSGPPPGNFVLAAATAVAVGVEMGKISSTSIAHSGLAYERAPDETDMRLLNRERVLTARGAAAMGGDRAIASANAGRGGGAGQLVVVQNRYRHKSFDEFVTDNIARPAALRGAVRSLVDSGGPVGHGSWVKS